MQFARLCALALISSAVPLGYITGSSQSISRKVYISKRARLARQIEPELTGRHESQ